MKDFIALGTIKFNTSCFHLSLLFCSNSTFFNQGCHVHLACRLKETNWDIVCDRCAIFDANNGKLRHLFDEMCTSPLNMGR